MKGIHNYGRERMSQASPRPRHSGKLRVFIFFNIALSIVTMIAGVGLVYANWTLGSRQVVTIDLPSPSDGDLNLPVGDLRAKNFLVTGSDNADCVDPNSRYAGGFGDRANYGERSDSIMVVRVNPIDNQAAILSFPRDMWVKQAGTGRNNRINSNFDKRNPNQLIRTIKDNFEIVVDHYVNVDFCAFSDIVDAVGGVGVPFPFRARDTRTGFRVLKANSCYNFEGDHALAYLRSRRYSWYDPAVGNWQQDGTSDWGRINRQQDFLKRMIRKSLDKSRSNPRVAAGILNASLKNVITDDRLTPLAVLQLSQAMKDFDTATMGNYTMPGLGQRIDNQSVIIPDFDSSTSKKILAVFQGKASLSTTLPEAKPASVTPTTHSMLSIVAIALSNTAQPPLSTTTTTTIPTVEIEQLPRGVVPPDDPTCPY
jgi:LCP family protein required for cell wall assembly